MKKIFFLALLAIIGVIVFSGCTQPESPPVVPGQAPSTLGTLFIGVKDKALDTGLLGSVKLTISSISIHSQNSDAWIVLSNEAKEFELLELQDIPALLANKDLNSGTYNQLRFSIEKVLVDYNSTAEEAKLPSNELKLNVKIEIDSNKISLAVLDFDLNNSFHLTGNGKIIMLPVIKIVSEKDSNAEIEGKNLRIRGNGAKTDEKEIGTDLEGNNGEGLKIGQDKNLEIDDSGKIKEKENQGNNNGQNDNPPGKGRLVGTIKDKALKEGRLSVSDINSLTITINSITIHRPNSTDENAKSWVELLNAPKTFDLLSLQNTEELLADLNMEIGGFTQIRLDINSAIAIVDETKEDANTETFIVKIPSNKLKLVSKIIVDENKTSYFNLDFDLNKSLHVTGNNQIILKPVIKLVSKRNVDIKKEGNKIRAEKGSDEEESETEFDENGNQKS